MCFIDLEPCEVWSEKTVKARKPHKCGGCGAAIKPGEIYLRHFDIFEGNMSAECACGACSKSRDEFADAHGQSFIPSRLDEMLWECIDGAASDEDTKRWRILYARLCSRRAQWAHKHTEIER